MGQDNRIHAFFLKHVDVLALLLLIRHIKYRVGMLFLILIDALRQGQILALQVLKDNIILHLFLEFLILDAAELNERINVIPVFFVGFPVGLAHAGQLICHLLGNVIGNLLYKTVILQSGTGYIQRKIRAVDDAF